MEPTNTSGNYLANFAARREVNMPEGSELTRSWHPRCCEVPMWLVEIQKGGPHIQHVFECKVCDKRTVQPADTEAA
jgi:hypothetical protein